MHRRHRRCHHTFSSFGLGRKGMQRQTDKSRPLRECREVAGRHIFIHPIHSHVDSNVSRFCRDQHLFFDLPRKTGFVMAIGCRPIRVERHRWKPPKVAPPPMPRKPFRKKTNVADPQMMPPMAGNFWYSKLFAAGHDSVAKVADAPMRQPSAPVTPKRNVQPTSLKRPEKAEPSS